MKKSIFILLFMIISASTFAGVSSPERIEDFSKYEKIIEKLYKPYSDIEKVEILSCYKYIELVDAMNDIADDIDEFFDSKSFETSIIPDYIDEPFALVFVVKITGKHDDGSPYAITTFTVISFDHFRQDIWY